MDSIRGKGRDTMWILFKNLEGDAWKIGHGSKVAVSKKSIIFVVSSWNFVKVIDSWVDHVDQVSWE